MDELSNGNHRHLYAHCQHEEMRQSGHDKRRNICGHGSGQEECIEAKEPLMHSMVNDEVHIQQVHQSLHSERLAFVKVDDDEVYGLRENETNRGDYFLGSEHGYELNKLMLLILPQK